MNIYSLIVLILMTVLLNGCANNRYDMRHDAAPLRNPTQLEQQDAKVVATKKSVSASRPYSIGGKRYVPMLDETGYQETGIASWYGRKFHGHKTSNGEIYDMFSMTAAHKTLPLPSFVRVTNLDNGKTAIVKVNDRGPFHDNRLIDLSYAAAHKLDYYRSGTARVKVEAVTVAEQHQAYIYIQVVAASKSDKIQLLSEQLKQNYQVATIINHRDGIYRLKIGPMKDAEQATKTLSIIQQDGFEQAFLLYSEVLL